MGLFDFLGGGGGGGDFSATQVPNLQPNQLAILNDLVSTLQSQFPGGQLQGITPFGGQRVAGFGPLQQEAFGLAGGLGQGIGAGIDIFGQTLGQFDPNLGGQFLGQAGDLLGGVSQGLDPQRILDALEPGRQLALNTFQQDTVPFLAERFGASSGASGAFNKQLAESAANLSLGLNAQAAPFLGQAALQQPGLDLSAARTAGDFAQLPGILAQQGTQLGGQSFDLLSQLFNIGGIQQGQQQAQLGATQQRFNEAQPFNNPFLNLLPTALNTQPFTTVLQPQGQTSQQAALPGLGSFIGGQSGGFLGGSGGTGGGGFLGGLSPTGGTGGDIQLALQLAAAFSDERLKENIETIDDALEKVKQLEGKTYNFKFHLPENRTGGVMAQSLEEVLPDAVYEINGVKVVHYDAVIGLLINAVNELAEKVA